MPNTINENLYKPYTKHMKKADKFTYRKGYEVIDQALVQDYYVKSIREIATELNEYDQRVIYRIQVLLEQNILPMRKNEFKKLVRKVMG